MMAAAMSPTLTGAVYRFRAQCRVEESYLRFAPTGESRRWDS